MSMSELYALSVIAHDAFLAACQSEARKNSSRYPVSTKCLEALSLLESCSNLILQLCQNPQMHSGAYPEFTSVQNGNMQTNLQRLQLLTFSYLAKIKSVCRMKEEHCALLDDSSCSRQEKIEAQKIYKEVLIAIKAIDKPNVHRLLELVLCTLPMVGQITRIGELVLEKTHQVVKRAIKLSNNRQVQLHAMQSAAINDWQGRLTMLVEDGLSSSSTARLSLRGCFRLLHGREYLLALNGVLSESHYKQILQQIGPPGLLPRELREQCCSVLSRRVLQSDQTMTWTLSGAYILRLDAESSTVEENALIRTLRIAYSVDLPPAKIFAAKEAFTRTSKFDGTRIKRGDILEFLCCNPHLPSFHRPFLVQTNALPSVADCSGLRASLCGARFSFYRSQSRLRNQLYLQNCCRACTQTQRRDILKIIDLRSTKSI